MKKNKSLKSFATITDVPDDCLAAPSIFFAPLPGTGPVVAFGGATYFRRGDVSQLLSKADWQKRGCRVKAGEQPVAHHGSVDPVAVFAVWQTESAKPKSK